MSQKRLPKYLGRGKTQRSQRLLLAIASGVGVALYGSMANANPFPLNNNNPQPEAIAGELPSEPTPFALSFPPPQAEALQVEERSFNSFFQASEAIAQESGDTDAELEALRNQYLLPVPATLVVPSAVGGSSPGSSSGTPTAFGSSWGRAYAGVGFQGRTRYTSKSDGTMAAGLGFGDARNTVGAEVTVTALSLLGDNAFQRGGISFKVHRLLPNNFAVAGGVENAIVLGGTDGGTSVYGVVSKIFQLKENTTEPLSRVTVSLGLGSGRFRSEDNINNDEGSINPFGSVGLRVAQPVSLIADWTGQDLILAASIVPFRNLPLVITPAIADITGNAGDGARFIMGVGYGYSLPF